MLLVGLTGGLGSGKSTAASRFAALGAHVLSADEIGRELMQPGQIVYNRIVHQFGAGVVRQDGSLDRAVLARLAFAGGRLAELTAIVHPATIERQAEISKAIAAREPAAVIVIESALIFETPYGGEDGWHRRFDAIVVVTAPEDAKIARFVARASAGRPLTQEQRHELEEEARRRMAQQLPDDWKAAHSDYVLTNSGPVEELYSQVDALWPALQQRSQKDATGTNRAS